MKVAKIGEKNFDKAAVITISDKPIQIGKTRLSAVEFELVKEFIILNKETLLAYWKDEIYSSDLVLQTKRIKNTIINAFPNIDQSFTGSR